MLAGPWFEWETAEWVGLVEFKADDNWRLECVVRPFALGVLVGLAGLVVDVEFGVIEVLLLDLPIEGLGLTDSPVNGLIDIPA